MLKKAPPVSLPSIITGVIGMLSDNAIILMPPTTNTKWMRPDTKQEQMNTLLIAG
ncbi:hypothetical protein K503DRAFT_806599 [Rhizopogon vinicolor AM-OR11-026]|uniref:Uncharacterized protein n=1 Tax=Rhizopogon vinicolor AM-OR11-026 TaxID=1314800 RepID=A0A1B7ME74_9AGAM|nr:hypothetical protein K503DRAFT_806599 [Rhizopogon vinicolor AM-OR11-026]